MGWWTVDTLDPERQARFWETLLGFRRFFEDPDEGVALVPPPGERGSGFLLYREGVAEPKQRKNRIHLDLRPADHHGAVDRARELGAHPVDIGQGAVSWNVLADPEGNEFCMLSAGEGGPTGVRVDAWTMDALDPHRLGDFWRDLLGWDEIDRDDESVLLRDPAGRGDDLLVLYSPDEKVGKNRVHPDLIPDGSADDGEARPREVARALELGASRADIGQGEVGWDVLADPEGNEFCILRPRDDV